MGRYKTVNRGWLKRQVEKGNVEAKCDYSYTDDYAWDAANNGGKTDWMPARLTSPYRDENGKYRCDHKDGFTNFDESDFRSQCGTAYRVEGEEEITFSTMQSQSFTLRIKK